MESAEQGQDHVGYQLVGLFGGPRMIKCQGKFGNIGTKVERTGDSRIRIVFDVITWNADEVLPELSRLQKCYIEATFREIQRPEEE